MRTTNSSPTPSIPMPTPLNDWTCSGDGLSNSSERFQEMVGIVRDLISSETHGLLNPGRVTGMAQLIMAQLAHVHHLAPTASPGRRKAFEAWGEQYTVILESEKMPDNTWVHKCGTTLKGLTYHEPIWYPELGPTVGGGEVKTVTRPYCPTCEELPA